MPVRAESSQRNNDKSAHGPRTSFPEHHFCPINISNASYYEVWGIFIEYSTWSVDELFCSSPTLGLEYKRVYLLIISHIRCLKSSDTRVCGRY